MASKLMNRIATPLLNRTLFAACAASLAIASVAAIAAPSSASRNNAAGVVQPTEAALTAMLSSGQVATPSLSDKPAELLHSAAPAVASNAPIAKRTVKAAPRTHQVWMVVTGYCPCSKCCGEDASGVTASGRPVSYNRGRFVAADTDLFPFGTKLSIPGYHDGQTVPVIDRGGAIKGRHIDVYFSSHAVAKEWGRRWMQVTVQDED